MKRAAPDWGLVDATYRWAEGATLLSVLTRADITAGDNNATMAAIAAQLADTSQGPA